MTSLKQHLIDDINGRIKEIEDEIKESKKQLKILDAELKVEQKLLQENFDVNEPKTKELQKQVEANVGAIEGIKVMEQNKVIELENEFKILRARRNLLKSREWSFDDEEI